MDDLPELCRAASAAIGRAKFAHDQAEAALDSASALPPGHPEKDAAMDAAMEMTRKAVAAVAAADAAVTRHNAAVDAAGF